MRQVQAQPRHDINDRISSTREDFVKHLLGLGGYAWNAEFKSWTHRGGQEDRGALAELRSGLGKAPGEMARVHRHVVPYLAEAAYDDRWYYLVATLFGAFPQHRAGYSLGKAYCPLRQTSESMETRFVALLNTHPNDLDDHLRHAVRLLAANEQPFDWFRLLGDLLQWDHPERYVQLRWARDFYRVDSDASDEAEDRQSAEYLAEREAREHE